MENQSSLDFNNKYRIRTKVFAVNLCSFFNYRLDTEVSRILVRQVIRSATSVAANFHAATRARSKNEFYSKICIVVEETDETVFWLEILIESGVVRAERISNLLTESKELLYLFSHIRKRYKETHQISKP